MYGSNQNNHNQDLRPSGGPVEKYDSNTLPESEQFQFPSHRRPPLHQHVSPGPTSAPAVAYHSDDYFSWPTEPTQGLENSAFIGGHSRNQRVQTQKNTQIEDQTARTSRRYSSHKIRHRSNLSHSFTEEFEDTVPGSLFARSDQHHIAGSIAPTTDISSSKTEPPITKSVTKKASKKPGFFLKLDDLSTRNTPLDKVQHQHRTLTGPVSDPNHGTAYDKIGFFASDAYLHQSGGGEIGQTHDNITPLMFPPNSEDHGYFGQFDSTDLPSISKSEALPGGFLSVTSKVHDPLAHSGTSGNNSDIDSYLNFPVDDFASAHPFDSGHVHPRDQEGADEIENTKAAAHFTPFSGLYSDHAFHTEYDDHRGHQSDSDNLCGNNLEAGHQKDHSDQAFFQEHKLGAIQHYEQNHGDYAIHQEHLHHGDRRIGHASEYRQTHAEHAHTDSQNGQESEYDVLSYTGLRSSHRQAKHSEPYIKEPSHPSYNDYSFDDQQFHGDLAYKSGSNADGDLISVSQAVANTMDLAEFDNLGSAEKKAVLKKRKGVKGIVCSICGKLIVRDFSRHIRIHDEAGRFQCIFPPGSCKHKSRKFNRPYDYKKHLLNVHFMFDDPTAKSAPNLTEKLHVRGHCNACGQRFVANEWLESHILTTDMAMKCHELQRIENVLRMNEDA